MKKILFSILVLAGITATAQVKVGSNPTIIDNSAMLQIESTTKGLLPPSMTTAQRTAIASPAKGLIIYDTTLDCLSINKGTSAAPNWECIGASAAPSVTANCATAGFNTGTYVAGVSVGSATYTVTITNNSFSSVTLSNNTSDLSITGVSGVTVLSVAPATLTLNAAQSGTITYTLQGTPATTGTLTGTWSKLTLNCVKTKAVTNGDATPSLPAGATVVSLSPSIQGIVSNTAPNKKIINVTYTGGLGSYDAYTSGWIANSSGSGEAGDTNSFRISYPAGTFSTSGTLAVTVEVDGDGSFNAKKISAGTTLTIATIPLNINGNYKGDITLKIVTCGAPTSNGGFLEFKCHNLGADESADPFTPSWQLNGAYFQWGKKPVDTNGDGYRTKPNSGTQGFAAAPTGPGAGQTNEAAVASWSASPAADGAWNLTEGSPAKTANDPCPSGYRVPTRNEWVSIYSTTPVNTQTNWSNVGTYSASPTNYSAGKNVNNSLLLPASGLRSNSNGALGNRGSNGYYWSSTGNGSNAYRLDFNSGSVDPVYLSSRLSGFSVRCVAE
jgi:uncharacterized protein (TIGR02145 family)